MSAVNNINNMSLFVEFYIHMYMYAAKIDVYLDQCLVSSNRKIIHFVK